MPYLLLAHDLSGHLDLPFSYAAELLSSGHAFFCTDLYVVKLSRETFQLINYIDVTDPGGILILR